MANEQLKFVFRCDTLDPQRTIQRVADIFVLHGIGAPEFELDGLRMSTPQLLAKVRGATNFDISGHGLRFIFASLPRFQLDLLIIRATAEAEAVVRWDDWASGLIEGNSFVMAWVVDAEYDHCNCSNDQHRIEQPVTSKRVLTTQIHVPSFRARPRRPRC